MFLEEYDKDNIIVLLVKSINQFSFSDLQLSMLSDLVEVTTCAPSKLSPPIPNKQIKRAKLQ